MGKKYYKLSKKYGSPVLEKKAEESNITRKYYEEWLETKQQIFRLVIGMYLLYLLGFILITIGLFSREMTLSLGTIWCVILALQNQVVAGDLKIWNSLTYEKMLNSIWREEKNDTNVI